MKKPRILVCDDDEDLLHLIRELLSDEYKVSVVYSVKKALQMLRRDRAIKDRRGRIAAVVVDLAFVNRDSSDGVEDLAGLDILGEIKKDPFLETVMFSGTGDAAAVSRSLTLGACRYVLKHPKSDTGDLAERDRCELTSAIADAVQQHSAMIELADTIDNWTEFHSKSQASKETTYALGAAKKCLDLILKAKGRDNT